MYFLNGYQSISAVRLYFSKTKYVKIFDSLLLIKKMLLVTSSVKCSSDKYRTSKQKYEYCKITRTAVSFFVQLYCFIEYRVKL